jgi:spermidine synthase
MGSILTGKKVLQEVNSPINGKIRVVKSLGLGTYIQVENLTQSGGIITGIWKKTLRKIPTKKEIRNVLILGLGGGTAAMLIRKYWPPAKITGVDIDPLMVKLGRKYLGLKDLKVVIADAETFLSAGKDKKTKYDLIIGDTYVGYEFPKKFEDAKFLSMIKQRLSVAGVAVFNRLYMADKRPAAVKFGEKLEKVFERVEAFYPEANVMFFCSGDLGSRVDVNAV